MKHLAMVLSAVIAFEIVGGFGARPAMAQQDKLPRIAVFGFDSAGLDPWWGGVGGFDPGDALSDLLTDKLVNANAYNVIDRGHIEQVITEQNFSQTGAVSQSTEAKLGRLLGANYLVFGRIIQVDRTGNNSGGLGGITRGLLGGAGISSQRITLHVSARVVDANSGRIVETVDDSEDKSGTSFSLGGTNWGRGGVGSARYRSSDFTSSTVGQLITQVAGSLSTKFDPSKMASAGSAGPSLTAWILDVEGQSVVINAGTNKHVSVGEYFTVYEVRSFKDPDSGKLLESHYKRESLEITSVDSETASGQMSDGSAKVGEVATSGQ